VLSVITAVSLAVVVPRTFLELNEVTIYTDGFAQQVFHVLTVLFTDASITDESPLFLIHLLRTGIAVFFQAVSALGGSPLEVLVLCFFVWPILTLFNEGRRAWIGILLFFIVFLLSFRSVLVCLSVGYLVMYQIYMPKNRYLVASYIFSSLSSGAVLLCVCLVLRDIHRMGKGGFGYFLYFIMSLISLVISGADKFVGFRSGDAGYEATVGNATGLQAAISRNTIVVSILSGDYVRAAMYIFLAITLLFFLIRSFFNPKEKWYRFVFLAGVPVMMLEGLGVIALLVPLLMRSADVYVKRLS
jgi:hypothetical protein